MTRRAPRVLVIVQNLPLQVDRRVRLETRSLVDAGYEVSVICPRGEGDPPRADVDGVAVYAYRPAPQASGALGYLLEFAWCWLRTALLSLVVRRERGFDVIQACNPPDTYWLLARLWRLAGVRFVFDHHDLNPELFRTRFGEPTTGARRAQHRALLWLERMTFRTADRVISTNESYREIALGRGGVDPERTAIVRSAPDTARMRPVAVDPVPGVRTLAYLGIMGPQDGVDVALDALHDLVHRRGRTDVRAVLMGFGDCLTDLRAQATRLGLDDVVTFTGKVGPREIGEHLSRSVVGLVPDPRSPLNDLCTMNKTMEYMAYGVVPVSFDLKETRRTMGGTGVVAPVCDPSCLADAVESLLDDDDRRVALALAGRERVVDRLDWRPQATTYVGVFDRLLGRPPSPPPPAARLDFHDEWGRTYVAGADLEAHLRARAPRTAPAEPRVAS